MENEVLIALLSKLVDDRIALTSPVTGSRGPRGPTGSKGNDGKSFNFAEHESRIRQWAKEFALKFEDLTVEQIACLRGKDGEDGKNGKGFVWESHRDRISEIIRSTVEGMSETLRLKFSDLSAEDIELLRGPRGRDGHNGRDFNFEEHREFFNTLRPKFSDFSVEEKSALKLRYSDLTEEEKASLRLKFEDLTPEQIALLRGPRGNKGQRGRPGNDGKTPKDGKDGRDGKSIRGLPGIGVRGRPGDHGSKGGDGKDAPQVTSVDVDQTKDELVFIFSFSDGSEIRSGPVIIPAPVNIYNGGSGGKRGTVEFETRVDEVDEFTTYVGKALPGNSTSVANWQIQRITVDGTETITVFADGNANFDNVWDDRAGLVYE